MATDLPKDSIILLAKRKADLKRQILTESKLQPCHYCQQDCAVSPATERQIAAENPGEPHHVVCTQCYEVHQNTDDEIAIPNAEVLAAALQYQRSPHLN